MFINMDELLTRKYNWGAINSYCTKEVRLKIHLPKLYVNCNSQTQQQQKNGMEHYSLQTVTEQSLLRHIQGIVFKEFIKCFKIHIGNYTVIKYKKIKIISWNRVLVNLRSFNTALIVIGISGCKL